jgi:hypothetical protein
MKGSSGNAEHPLLCRSHVNGPTGTPMALLECTVIIMSYHNRPNTNANTTTVSPTSPPPSLRHPPFYPTISWRAARLTSYKAPQLAPFAAVDTSGFLSRLRPPRSTTDVTT